MKQVLKNNSLSLKNNYIFYFVTKLDYKKYPFPLHTYRALLIYLPGLEVILFEKKTTKGTATREITKT